MIQKTIRLSLSLLLACIVGLSLNSCVDAEEGESWDDYEFRNAINCGKLTSWHIILIKDENGKWLNDYQGENTIVSFDVQFFSKDHNFHSTKFYWTQNEKGEWIGDDATREEYKPADNTAFTLDSKALTIEGTVGGEKYFRISLDKKVDGAMEGKLHFYRENKTFEVKMVR